MRDTLISEKAGELGWKLVADMERMTWGRSGRDALANVERNQPLLSQGKSLAALRGAPLGQGDHAIVVAAGPSVKKRDPLKRIKASGYRGAIIATDSALYYCLRNGVVPDLVVTVDPHHERIVRWFGVPDLDAEKLAADDYFRRQDMDADFSRELETNRQVLELLDRHGRGLKLALATSASPAVVERAFAVGMDVYWWNPMFDDPDLEDGLTRAVRRRNGLPCVNAGGNVGAACWMMAHAVLGKRRVALTGIDFSYYADTPRRNTQYYVEALALVGEENLDAVYMDVHNPYLNQQFYTDPAYMSYRQAFLELAREADCQTYNCTEGGILFGDAIQFVPLDDFLVSCAS